MIESFLCAAWILGQGVYWSLFKLQTEAATEASWEACLSTLQALRLT